LHIRPQNNMVRLPRILHDTKLRQNGWKGRVPEKKKREKYYQGNGCASEEMERYRAKGRWMNGVRGTKISKIEGRESKKPDTTGSIRDV
jgi:hypothetical protein